MFSAWRIFRRGKATKKDVLDFEMHLEDNIFSLYDEIRDGRYKHLPYKHFQIFDNKKRDIYKAEVKDRIVHQIVSDYLVFCFDPTFIADSYASRIGKGQYGAIKTFGYFIKLASTRRQAPYVLKCDVKKYFDNIDHEILIGLISEKVVCKNILKIIKEIISSYVAARFGVGIPLGNITSQIFANIYLNALDQYIKKDLRRRFYVRYNDDFVIVFENRKDIITVRDKIRLFAKERLFLDIPIEKTSIRKINWGVDFLGCVVLPRAVLLRDKTKHKIFVNINRGNMHSYLAILKHCNAFNLKTRILAMEKIYQV